MAVNCRTCKSYQDSIALKYDKGDTFNYTPCMKCADFKHRKSFYEPINRPKGVSAKADEQTRIPGL